MIKFTWKELAIADAYVTNQMFDNSQVQSHKVLIPNSSDKINKNLVDLMTEKYAEACIDFEFRPVDYLPSLRYTNLGVFAKKEIEKESFINLDGFLAKLPKSDDFPEDISVSIFKRKGEELMLGPLSFVNHSCWPNAVYIVKHGWLNKTVSLNSFIKLKTPEINWLSRKLENTE